MPPIARVMPLTTTRAVRGPFDYLLDRETDGVEVGSLLRIPFGSRAELGVVVALSDRSELPLERLAAPGGVAGPPLTPDLVELALWMAHEYCSTPARALSLMLAPGSRKGAGPRQVLTAEITPAGELALHNADSLNPGQRAALQALSARGQVPTAGLGTDRLRRLERRGLVSIERRASGRRPSLVAIGHPARQAPVLTGAQEGAAAEIVAALRAREPAGFLLHGVTGSGKTEVYLSAVQETLQMGRDAIVLVPEIGLTPQVLGRFQARFGDRVAVLHSGLGQGERHDEWARLRSRQARVCVGPRSAVLAPVADLGLIVIDEEHDASYKHEGDPRYDARGLAAQRARLGGAVLVCGSATPRPESVHQLRRLRLTDRVDGRPLPPVEILDMRGQHHPLHPSTRMSLVDVRRAGEKAIVLLNRRGWSNFLSCRACGRFWSCPNCDVGLVLHTLGGGGSFVACHHCGHREAAPGRCPACGSGALARHGAGTERLEHELEQALGGEGFPVFRLDADVRPEQGGRTLAGFEAAPAGVLVGTQVVAKGHDFPDVTLGVVLDADQTLRFPDFRAEERTFSLITQLAGRAGRGSSGRVLVQTLAPEARSIRFAARHDSDGFVTQELAYRRGLGYPPFGTLIRIICSSTDASALDAVAAELRDLLASVPGSVLGPAPLFRLRGRARRQLLVKSEQRAAAIAAVGGAVELAAERAARREVALAVDVDPQ